MLLSGHKRSFLPNILSSGIRKKSKIVSGQIFCRMEWNRRLTQAAQSSEKVSISAAVVLYIRLVFKKGRFPYDFPRSPVLCSGKDNRRRQERKREKGVLEFEPT